MIARVRIAPMEHWCERLKREARIVPEAAAKIVGLEIEIETSSMQIALCDPDSRLWLMTPESAQRFYEIAGTTGNGKAGICEHMLEMD